MSLFSLEHGKLAYWSDFVFYGVVVSLLLSWIVFASAAGHGVANTAANTAASTAASAALVLLGLASWSLLEYLIHRFLLHGVAPFSEWHARHHLRPTALISAPTVLSATLFALLVFLPLFALGGMWASSAFFLGVLAGYLAYALVHHATHHWRAGSAGARRRKRWHALHHRHAEQGCCYGVSSGLWDRVFATTPYLDQALQTPASHPSELAALNLTEAPRDLEPLHCS